MESDGAYRREIFENLLDAVKTHARVGEIEIAKGDGGEFTMKLLGVSPATCTVELLPCEPSFQVHFSRPQFSLNNVSFTVSDRDYDHLRIKTTRCFAGADEASTWLIESLTLKPSVERA